MLSSKDINFVGYTYKNFEIVNDYQVPGIGITFAVRIPFSVDLCQILILIVQLHVKLIRICDFLLQPN